MSARSESTPAQAVPAYMGPLTGAAYDLAAMVEGLDVLHVTANITSGGCFPPNASEVERRAINALGPMIQLAIRMANDLAERIERAERVKEVLTEFPHQSSGK